VPSHPDRVRTNYDERPKPTESKKAPERPPAARPPDPQHPKKA
jgi:hypothetical protein